MSIPLVSVIIPMYNSAPWIGAAVESVVAQSWPAVEVIVVDDGSTDGGLAVALALADRHANVQVLTQPNGGVCRARNRGLEAARGQLIQYLDADDLLHPGKIAAQVARLRDLPAGFVSSGPWGRFHGSLEDARFVPEPVWADLSPVEWLVTSWGGGGMMPLQAWLVPRSVAERAGPWDEAVIRNSDGEYFTRVVLASRGMAFCPDARSYYRSGVAGSLSRQRDPEMLAILLRSLVRSAERLRAVEDSPRTRAAAAAQLQRFVYDTYPDASALVLEAEGHVQRLGGSRLPPPVGGRASRVVSALFGWKAMRHLQRGTAATRAALRRSFGGAAGFCATAAFAAAEGVLPV